MHMYWQWSRKGLEHRKRNLDNKGEEAAQGSTPSLTTSNESMPIQQAPKISAGLCEQIQNPDEQRSLSQNGCRDELSTTTKLAL